MKLKPKECVHNTCSHVFFVPYYQMHLPLMCPECTDKKREARDAKA